MPTCELRLAHQDQIATRNLELHLRTDGVMAGESQTGVQQLASGEWVAHVCLAPGTHTIEARWFDPADEMHSEWSAPVDYPAPTYVPEPGGVALLLGVMVLVWVGGKR